MPPGENELFNFEIRDPETGYYERGTVTENDENCGYNLNEYIKSMLEMLVARIESRKAREHAARDSSRKSRSRKSRSRKSRSRTVGVIQSGKSNYKRINRIIQNFCLPWRNLRQALVVVENGRKLK